MTFVIWMTGLPCSGKTTLSKKLKEKIPNLAILDGDEIREWFSSKNFTREGISQNNKSAAHVAKLLYNHNIPVCVALVSPYEDDRKNAKSIISNNGFLQIYLKCSNETCEQRDVKGMYKKARDEIIKNFLGIDNRYESPQDSDLVVDTESHNVDECSEKIISFLHSKKLLK